MDELKEQRNTRKHQQLEDPILEVSTQIEWILKGYFCGFVSLLSRSHVSVWVTMDCDRARGDKVDVSGRI